MGRRAWDRKRRSSEQVRRGRRAAWGTLAAAAASFCAVERLRGMGLGLGLLVAACWVLTVGVGAAAGPAKILGSRAVEAAGLPLKCAQL